jgi:hypothetical protein
MVRRRYRVLFCNHRTGESTDWNDYDFLCQRVHFCNQRKQVKDGRMLSWRCFERVHFCNHLVGAAAIAVALEQTVTLLGPRVMITVLLVVARVSLVPMFLAISLVGSIVGIAQELFFLPLSFAGSLAILITTVALVLDAWIGFEKTSTMDALVGQVHGFPPPQENHNATGPKEMDCS